VKQVCTVFILMQRRTVMQTKFGQVEVLTNILGIGETPDKCTFIDGNLPWSARGLIAELPDTPEFPVETRRLLSGGPAAN
jgi:hypothetical protein